MSASPQAEASWLKIDFHLHSREDPRDVLDHSAIELLDRAHALGFSTLAFTLHDHVLLAREVFEKARELGVLLIPAVERRLEGADVVIVNVTSEEATQLNRLEDLRALRQRRGGSVLIVAPHPFYLLGGSIGRRLSEYLDVFDALEFSHFYTRWLNPNRRAIRLARETGKPLLAASDTHVLDYFGHHYSRVQAHRDSGPEAIFEAIRANRIEIVSQPLSTLRLLRQLWWIYVEHQWKLARKWLRR